MTAITLVRHSREGGNPLILGRVLPPEPVHRSRMRGCDEVRAAVDVAGVCRGACRSFLETMRDDPRCSTGNPRFEEVDRLGMGRFMRPSPCSPWSVRCRTSRRRVPGACRSFLEMVHDGPRCSTRNPRFEEVDPPGIGRFKMLGSPPEFRRHEWGEVRPAPTPGQHTDEILAEVSGCTGAWVGEMRDGGIVA